MSTRPPKNPLIAVVGTTGTGKSQLAVALAEKFDGEIINADALQMYVGLPIVTNKITKEERKGIPHHLLGCIGLDEKTWTVSQFTKEAAKIIEEIRGRGKVPIVVGGTHYYTQALLFLQGHVLPTTEKQHTMEEQAKKWPILAKCSAEMLEELQRLDPVTANRWHPKEERKIRRSLEICLQTGRRASDVYAEQRMARMDLNSSYKSLGSPDSLRQALQIVDKGPVPPSSSLRYETLFFWPYTDQEALIERLDLRVDDMIRRGLILEIQSMSDCLRGLKSLDDIDLTRGIWVAIGFKEFATYFSALRREVDAADLETLKQKAIELVKIATRQYAKRQLRWIKLTLLKELQEARQLGEMFLLDRNGPLQGSLQLESVAFDIAGKFLTGDKLPDPKSLSENASLILKPSETSREHVNVRTCEACSVTVTTAKSWEAHVNSKKHKKLILRPEKMRQSQSFISALKQESGLPR